MKLTSKIIVGALLSFSVLGASAQSIPQLQNPGIVAPSPIKAVPYFALAGNRVAGGTVLTFDDSTGNLATNLLTSTAVYSPNGTLIFGTDDGGGPAQVAHFTSSVGFFTTPVRTFGENTFEGHIPGGAPSSVMGLTALGLSNTIHVQVPNGLAADYNLNLPLTAGTAGQVSASGGGGTSIPTWISPTGAGVNYVTASGVPANGCPVWVSGNLNSTGSPCSTSSGSVNPGTATQVGTYATTGSTISGAAALTFDGTTLTSPQVLVSDSGGVFGASNLLNLGTYDGTFFSPGLTIGTVSHVVTSDLPFSGFNTITANALRPPSCGYIYPFFLASIGVSQTIDFGIPCALGASYNFNMPLTAGTAGQVLTSGGGGAASNTWTTPSFGNVNPGTVSQMGFYQTTGSTISPLPNAANSVLVTDASSNPSLSGTIPLAVQGVTTRVGTLISGTWNASTITVPFGGTGLTSGSVGTIPYFNTSTSMSTSSSLTPGHPIISTGGAPSSGAVSGDTTSFSTVSGSLSAGCTSWTAGGVGFNLTASGTPCGVGTVTAGTAKQVAWYQATGNTVVGLATGLDAVLATDGAGNPSMTQNPVIGGTTTTTDMSVIALTPNGVVYTNGSQLLRSTPVGTTGQILIGNTAAAPGYSSSPTISTSVTTPLLIGGTTASSTLTLESTSGAGTTDSILFKAGSQATKMNVTTAGVGIGATAPTALLQLAAGSTVANTAPLKFVSGPVLSTPESGATEFDGSDFYVTSSAVRKTVHAGTMGAIAAATLTTTNATIASLNMASGESYIVDTELELTSSANTLVIGFNGTNVGANTLTITDTAATGIASAAQQLVANSGGTITTANTLLRVKITGLITATATGAFSINVRTTAGTVNMLGGSYFSYTHL